MALYHAYSEVENSNTGVPMAGVQVVPVFPNTGEPGVGVAAPIYADESETPFVPANTCLTDETGMYSFYIEPGSYNLDFFIGSRFIRRIEDVQFINPIPTNVEEPYRATLSEALNEFPIGFYFRSDDKNAEGPHPNEMWIYQRIGLDPGYVALVSNTASMQELNEAIAQAQAAATEAQNYGNATLRSDYASADAESWTAGVWVQILSTDTGTHASKAGDFGASGGQTPNAGLFQEDATLGLIRKGANEGQVAKGYSDSAEAAALAAAASASSIAGQSDILLAMRDIISGVLKSAASPTLRIADTAGNYPTEVTGAGSGNGGSSGDTSDTVSALRDIVGGTFKSTASQTTRIADGNGNYTFEANASGSGISTKPVIDLIIGYGQSNSTTWVPGLTTSRGLSNLSMFIGGVVIADPNNQAATIPAGATDALVPLASDTRESFVTSCAEWLHDNAGLNVVAVTCGVNGQAYANLAKGTPPYANLIATVTALQALFAAQGATVRATVLFQHQEADYTDSRAAYRTKLDALTNDLNADIITITSQSVVHVFAGQAGSLSRSQPPLAAFEKAKVDSRFHLIPSFYALPYASGDPQHLDSYGRHNLGFIYGRAIKQVLSGLKYTPFQPKTAVRSGATITVTMEGQTGIPQIDTTAFPALPDDDMGFEAFTSGGATVAISSVAATNTGYTITFADSTVAATVALIRTAWTAPSATSAPQGSIKGAGTNLHDQAILIDPVNSRALPNWCVISETAVS